MKNGGFPWFSWFSIAMSVYQRVINLFQNNFGNPGTSKSAFFSNVFFFLMKPIITSYHPELNIEPENHSFGKEQDIPNFHFSGSSRSFFLFLLHPFVSPQKQRKNRNIVFSPRQGSREFVSLLYPPQKKNLTCDQKIPGRNKKRSLSDKVDTLPIFFKLERNNSFTSTLPETNMAPENG